MNQCDNLCKEELGVKTSKEALSLSLLSSERLKSEEKESLSEREKSGAPRNHTLLFSPSPSVPCSLLRQKSSRHRTEWPPRSLAWPENERQGKETPFVREEDRKRELEKEQELESTSGSSSSGSGSFGSSNSRSRTELVPASAAAAASLYGSSS